MTHRDLRMLGRELEGARHRVAALEGHLVRARRLIERVLGSDGLVSFDQDELDQDEPWRPATGLLPTVGQGASEAEAKARRRDFEVVS